MADTATLTSLLPMNLPKGPEPSLAALDPQAGLALLSSLVPTPPRLLLEAPATARIWLLP